MRKRFRKSFKLTEFCWDNEFSAYMERVCKGVEIIKNKSVNLDHLKHSRDYLEYCVLCEYYVSITYEEYELLKEVLL